MIGQTASWSAPCFHNFTATVQFTGGESGTPTGAVITVTTASPSSRLCSDYFLLGTREHVYYKVRASGRCGCICALGSVYDSGEDRTL
jgi:hypothetical protein